MESSAAEKPAIETAKPLKKLPRVPFRTSLKLVTSPMDERINMRARLQERHALFGVAACQNLAVFRLIHLFGPDANRFVLLDKDRIFSARKPWMAIMGRIFPNGLLLMDGDEHKLNRKIMHTAFTRPALRGYAERMNPMVVVSNRKLGRSRRTVRGVPGDQGAHSGHGGSRLRRRPISAPRRPG